MPGFFNKPFKKLLLLIITGFLAFGISIFVLGSGEKSGPESSTEKEKVKVEYDFPVVILTKFRNIENSINKKQLAQRDPMVSKDLIELVGENELSAFLEEKTGEKINFEIFDQEDITFLNNGDYPGNVLLLALPEGADFRLKILSLNSKHPFGDEDYGLNYQDTREVASTDPAETHEGYVFDRKEINTMFLGGEMIPARAVDRLFLNQTNNYTFLFDRFKQDMQSADLTIAMLENPIAGDPTPCTGCTTFVGDGRNAKGFSDVGIDLLGFGNHAGDGGLSAIQETEKLLKKEGIGFTGVSSENLDGAAKLIIKDFGGKKVGFLAADDVAWFYWAGESRWGNNHFSQRTNTGQFVVDHERIKEVVGKADKKVDHLIIMMSWGVEYTNVANAHQVEMAHDFIDNGADMIVSSHPHWVQNFEVYKGKPIFYSLGNLIFDQTHTQETRESIVVKAYYLNNDLKNFTIIPILNCGYHQSLTNLANKVISGEMSYEQVDALPESQGCIYWQPKPIDQSRVEYRNIWERFLEGTEL